MLTQVEINFILDDDENKEDEYILSEKCLED
jgi:hypothetical protein